MRHPTERLNRIAERGLPVSQRSGHITGTVPGTFPGGGTPLLIYTDGSVSRHLIADGLGRMTGWGYLATDGHWGCGTIPQFENSGFDVPVTTELRAVWHAINTRLAARPLTVLLDSSHAIAWLTRWKNGDTNLPPGYTGKRSHGTPTLRRLQQLIAKYPRNLSVRKVAGHADDTLNIGADTLAQLGMRWARDALTKKDVRDRAARCAEGFLAQWRRQ